MENTAAVENAQVAAQEEVAQVAETKTKTVRKGLGFVMDENDQDLLNQVREMHKQTTNAVLAALITKLVHGKGFWGNTLKKATAENGSKKKGKIEGPRIEVGTSVEKSVADGLAEFAKELGVKKTWIVREGLHLVVKGSLKLKFEEKAPKAEKVAKTKKAKAAKVEEVTAEQSELPLETTAEETAAE